MTYRTLRPSISMLEDKGATVLQADFSTEAAIDRAIDEIKAISKTYRAVIHNASDWAQEKDNSNKHSLIETNDDDSCCRPVPHKLSTRKSPL